MMNKIDDLCLWKDLYYQNNNRYIDCGLSVFKDHEKWKEDHLLYKCIDCGGYDSGCPEYKSLKEINRKR